MSVHIGKQSTAHTLHDSTELAVNSGFVPDASGSFSGRLRHDDSDRTINVVEGVFYPFDIKLAKDTGKVGVATILVIFAYESKQQRPS